MDGRSTPAMFMYAAEGLKEDWVKHDGPESRIWDVDTNQWMASLITANKKGGMKDDLTATYIREADRLAYFPGLRGTPTTWLRIPQVTRCR